MEGASIVERLCEGIASHFSMSKPFFKLRAEKGSARHHSQVTFLLIQVCEDIE